MIAFILLLTTFFIRDYLIKSNVSETQMNQLAQSNIISSQIAPYMNNINNQYTRSYVEDIIKQHSLDSAARVLVIDQKMNVILDSYDDFESQNIDLVEVRYALMGTNSANIYKHEVSYVMYTAVPIIFQNEIIGVIFMSINADFIFENVQSILDKLIIIFLIALFVSFFISVLFAEIISTPIEFLTESVKKITLGNYQTKVEVKGNDEIGELGSAFNSMTAKLFQVDDRRKKFVSNVSHELRTPMTSMKILSDTLLSQEHWDEAIYREFMQDINSEIDRLNNIIDSLLYLVRIEKDEIELDYSVTYVNYLIEKVIKTIRPIAQKKHIETTFVSNNKIQINLDQEKMQQCLLNIIGNAVKYTPENGMVNVSLLDHRDTIAISIVDNGIGIPEKDIPYIFDRFYRVDEARARKTGGTGLGLSIAQQIVMLHQGSIEVTSHMNQGTNVTIILPKN
ncbi:HAMP domain-containing protein [Fusibacter sp. Q10-2]|uniref:histidine kinase n=1 Tax=Fusibacter ferrireducens TaxID=2785058 RepID=A0ABR9ZYC4_9FIRM|nr:HAMP domain-containing protein [Fusibacter ferrireducens]